MMGRIPPDTTSTPESGGTSGRPPGRRVRRVVAAALAVVATAAVGWFVTRALDAGSDALDEKPLLHVSIEKDPARAYAGSPPWQTASLILPNGPPHEKPPKGMYCRKWYAWGWKHGAVDADTTEVFLTLQGREATAILINRVEVEVVRRAAPVRGTHARCEAGGAVSNPRLMDVDLDTTPATVLFAQAGDDFPGRQRLHLKLNGTATEELRIRAHTRRCACDWRVRIGLVVNGEQGEVLIDDDGEPFRTTASRAARHVRWNGKRWTRIPRREWRRTLPISWQNLDLPSQ